MSTWGLVNQMIIPTIATPKISMEPIIDGQTYSNTTYARMLLDQMVKPTSTSRCQQNQAELQQTNMDISLETPVSSGQQGQGFPPASQLTRPLASNSVQEQKRKASEMLQNHRAKRQRRNSAGSGSSTPPSLGLGASLPSQKAILPALQFQMDGMRLSPSLESPMSTSGSSRSTTVGLGETPLGNQIPMSAREPLKLPKPPMASQNPQEVIHIEDDEDDILGDLDKVFILSPIKGK